MEEQSPLAPNREGVSEPFCLIHRSSQRVVSGTVSLMVASIEIIERCIGETRRKPKLLVGRFLRLDPLALASARCRTLRRLDLDPPGAVTNLTLRCRSHSEVPDYILFDYDEHL